METTIKKNRDITFDIVRSLCIIEIVCIWHMSNYINQALLPEWFFIFFGWLTDIALATFTLMSSYFLKRKKVENWGDVKYFYISRFKRFWILFFVASSLLFVASSIAGQPWWSSTSDFILSLLGLSIFIGELPPTLWFMVVMMFFYIITPSILCLNSRTLKILVCGTFLIIFIALYQLGYLDERVLWYFPLYALGLIIPDSWAETNK